MENSNLFENFLILKFFLCSAIINQQEVIMNDFEIPEKKLELDKIALPENKHVKKNFHNQHPIKSDTAIESPFPKTINKITNRYVVAFSICLTITVSAMVIIFFLWETEIFEFPFFKREKVYKPWEIYANIGPIHTTAGKAGDVRMTVNINCKTPDIQKIVTENSSAIKARLLFSLSSPGVDQMIIKKDYEALKAYIRDEINSVLSGNNIDEVYFSDFLIY